MLIENDYPDKATQDIVHDSKGVFVDTKADAAQADTLAEQQAFGVAYAKGILDTLGLAYDEPEEEPDDAFKTDEAV